MPERQEHITAHCIVAFYSVLNDCRWHKANNSLDSPVLDAAAMEAKFIRDGLIDQWVRDHGTGGVLPTTEEHREAVVEEVTEWIMLNLDEFIAYVDGEPSEVH